MKQTIKPTLLIFLLTLTQVTQLKAQPGGVNNAELWLKANAGVIPLSSVSLWQDQSGNGRDGVQNKNRFKPSYQAIDVNFNPTLKFSGDSLDVAHNPALNGADLTVLIVLDLDGGNGYRSPWTTRNSGGGGHILYYRGSYLYWTAHGGFSRGPNAGVSTNNYEILTTTSKNISVAPVKIEKNIYKQGIKGSVTITTPFRPNTLRPFRIGKGATERVAGRFPWPGDIAEVIVYSKSVTDNERHRIESYLAIKYGITLNQNSGGQDYLSSASSTIWSASINSGFGHDIAGLAEDASSDLSQKVAKSINDDAIVTIASSNNFTTANSDSSRPSIATSGDQQFLVWSNDNQRNTWANRINNGGGKILNRKWKIQKTGNTQKNVGVQIDVDDSDFDVDAFAQKLYFVKASTLAGLETATAQVMTQNGSLWHIDNINFNDGDFFSFVALEIIMEVTKTSQVIKDPINITSNPKSILGATIRYCFTVDNMGDIKSENVEVKDTLDAKFNYIKSGSMIQNINVACNCNSTLMDDSKGTINGANVTIDIGVLSDKNTPASSRACAYLEAELQ